MRSQRVNLHQQYQQTQQSKPTAFGFSGRMFALLAFITSFVSYTFTYLVAADRHPPDVRPFPNTDILHTAIHWPQYLIYRIGMLVYPVLFCLTVQTLKNFLQIKSFELKGQADTRLRYLGGRSILACLALCLATASISDGGDLNYDLYYVCTYIYWGLALDMIWTTSCSYRQLWEIDHFVHDWSYQFKNYGGYLALGLAVAHILQLFGVIDFGYWTEWIISYLIVFHMLTLFWDLKDMDLLLRRK